MHIPYAADPEPTYVQTICVRAAAAGWRGCGKPLQVVILPGYDAGSLFFFRQLRPLAALGCDVRVVDLLGHGMSSRPRFEGRTREEGEAFYVDALEAWREAEGIDSYCLIGHSFGGYLASCWALAAPKLVRRLVLVGSAGMEQVNRACLGPNGTPWGLEGLALEGFNALWHAVQPQAIVRMAGPFGPGLASDYIRKKFGPHSAGGHLTADESVLLERYLFHCLAGGGKGAVANPPPHHALFFGPGAVCYAPLSERLDALDAPISFVYGLYDWMDWRDAERVRQGLSRPATLSLVENAGHHLYLENAEGFLDALAHSLAPHLPGGRAAGAPTCDVLRFCPGEPGDGADAAAEAVAERPGGHGAPLPPPLLFMGVCRYPSGYERAASDEALELCLAAVEAELLAEEGADVTALCGPVPYSDRIKTFGLYEDQNDS